MSALRPGASLRLHALLTALLVSIAATAIRAPAQSNAPVADLPLKRVVLFTSGVGFYDRVGEVEGDAKVRLSFRTDDVNDLLKSLVVQDFGGGRIGAITYSPQDPIERTLESFSIDLTEGPSLVTLLNQVRGERLRVEAPSAIDGVLIGVEEERETVVGGVKIEHDLLVLLTAEGLTRIPVDTVCRLKLLNPKLDAELRRALDVLARENAADRRTVTCAFDGQGRRRVRVAYIQESPIWKTSYRLVLSDDGQPLLQGWAVVENTTEEDWNGVQLTLVSGRPISFVMDLYAPVYLARPEVALETYASLRPQVHARSSGRTKSHRGRPAKAYNGPAGTVPTSPGPTPTPSPSGGAAVTRRAARNSGGFSSPRLDPDQGVESAASAAEVGELFQYVIDAPVTLARQRSAMLPIVNTEVKGEKLSIFNPEIHAVHPLNGFRLENTSKLHLMQGPITVFDGGAYAGDAQIRDLAAGESRLISYALDLDCEVKVQRPAVIETCTGGKIAHGVLILERKRVRTRVYEVTNAGTEDKTVLVEHARASGWRRTAPMAAHDRSRKHDRFRVQIAAGEEVPLYVEEEQVVSGTFYIRRMDEDDVQACLERRGISDAVKDALREVVRRRSEIDRCADERRLLEERVKTIDQERTRVAGIMTHVDRTSELYKRYLAKLTRFEDELEEARPQIARLQKRETELKQLLADHIAQLELN